MSAVTSHRGRLAQLLERPGVRWMTLAAALWVLNFALTFHNVWPTWLIETRHELSIEIALLLLGLALFSEWRQPPRRRLLTGLALLLLVMSIGRYAEVTAPALYGRPVNLYWDARHLPNVAAMLAKVANPWIIALGLAALVGFLAAIFALLRWALGRVFAGLAVPAERRAIALAAASLVVLFAVGHSGAPLRTLGWFSLPVTGTYKQQVEFLLTALHEATSGSLLPPPVYLGDRDLTRVAGADVLLVFVESYGATSYDDSAKVAALEEARAGLAEAVRDSGRRAVSAFVESPTFGGASWLAHASFMSALPIDNGGAYQLLLTQDRDSLPRRFERAGYRSIAVMPGLRSGWPEGAFYGFDTIYGAEALDYRGPEFGWWRIPDQYALAKLDELELAPEARKPLFAFFPTISTHIPFRPTPPLQPDWARVLSADPYDEAPLAESLATDPDWLDLSPAYVDSLRYTYRYWSSYLLARPSRDFVLILLGDHQPAASVTGEGARWDVPVHVIASRPQVLEALERYGFSPGFTPRGGAIGEMRKLAPTLLQVFAEDALLTDSKAAAGSLSGERVPNAVPSSDIAP